MSTPSRSALRSGRSLLLGCGLLSLSAGCSLASNSSVSPGIGAPCQRDSDCQAAHCALSSPIPGVTGGICATSCSSDGDCASGSLCAKGLCQVPLTVGVALTGNVTELEGWTFAHVQALDQAASTLGYLKLDKHFGLTPGNVLPDIVGIAQNNQIVLGNTVDYTPDFQAAAQQFLAAGQSNKFLCIDDGVFNVGTANFSSYWIRRVEAWYAAGKIAAGIGKKRLGVISAFINPETVADVNAFTLGARSVNPAVVVEVRHMGFWFDTNDRPTYSYTNKYGTNLYYREEYLAALMVDSGCEVIAHLGNTQRPVRLIERLKKAGQAGPNQYSFANDNQRGYLDGSGQPIASCVGAIYENWTPLYLRVFEAVHRGTFDSTHSVDFDIDDTDNTPTGVSINPSGPGDSIAAQKVVQDLARAKNPGPEQRVLLGPYKTTGQRDQNNDGIPDADQSVAAGSVIDIAEASRLCWYVDGVVERVDLSDPASADRPALVPGGLVPGATTAGSRVPYPVASDTLILPSGLSSECLKNSF